MWQAFGKHAAIAFGAGAGRAAMNHGIERFFSGSGRAAKLPGRKWKTVSGVPIYRDEWDDFVVIVDRDNADSWYWTDDPRDAVDTAKVMAKGRSAQGRSAKGRAAQGRRAAPTTKQRKSMGQKLQALPWNQASALYKRNHPKYKGIGGYPMNTKQRASGARAYAISSYNAGKLTKKDVETIFRRTGRKYPSMPKFDGMVCQKTRKNAKRRKCSSRTSR